MRLSKRTNRVAVMAILNVTPDSFYESSRALSSNLTECVERAIADGATIIDVGGYSSRPGAAEVSLEEEWRRVDMGVRAVRDVSKSVVISVDTFRSEIVRRVYENYGSFVVNDITAGDVANGGDSKMIRTVAELGLPYIAMHMRGTPATMQQMTDYSADGGVVESVLSYFKAKIEECQAAGVKELILDPGFGFAKSLEQNYELLSALDRLCDMGCEVLVGVSRKSMIYRLLGCEPKDALAGTNALNWEALSKGATILRVHDVRDASDVATIFEKYRV
ncbi:MAG: dihydropteroate synthase [Rikenellaceae bacterium]